MQYIKPCSFIYLLCTLRIFLNSHLSVILPLLSLLAILPVTLQRSSLLMRAWLGISLGNQRRTFIVQKDLLTQIQSRRSTITTPLQAARTGQGPSQLLSHFLLGWLVFIFLKLTITILSFLNIAPSSRFVLAFLLQRCWEIRVRALS